MWIDINFWEIPPATNINDVVIYWEEYQNQAHNFNWAQYSQNSPIRMPIYNHQEFQNVYNYNYVLKGLSYWDAVHLEQKEWLQNQEILKNTVLNVSRSILIHARTKQKTLPLPD